MVLVKLFSVSEKHVCSDDLYSSFCKSKYTPCATTAKVRQVPPDETSAGDEEVVSRASVGGRLGGLRDRDTRSRSAPDDRPDSAPVR